MSNLCQALYSRLFDVLVETINTSLMFGGASRYFIGAVDIFGFECFPHNSLEQERSRSKSSHMAHCTYIFWRICTCIHSNMHTRHIHACTHAHEHARIHLCQLCINFANEKLQRMFTEAVFESILAEYKKEGIEVRARPRTAPII